MIPANTSTNARTAHSSDTSTSGKKTIGSILAPFFRGFKLTPTGTRVGECVPSRDLSAAASVLESPPGDPRFLKLDSQNSQTGFLDRLQTFEILLSCPHVISL